MGNFQEQELKDTVLYSLRLPRLIVACLCGASLSAAGVVSQGLFRNPLACPSVLGASSGGVLGVILIYFFFSPWQHWFAIPLGAVLTTALTMFLLLKLFRSLSSQQSSQLLLCGFALTTLLAAFSSLLMSFLLTQMEKTMSLMQWMMGGFSGRGWEHVFLGLPLVLLGICLAFLQTAKLDMLTFGEELASSMNLDVNKLQKLSVFSIACLVGASVSVAGTLPFVSLIVPHFTRKFTGAAQRFLLPCSILNGMILLIVGDFLAQRLFYPKEMELGIFTSLLGGIFFLSKILRS